MKHQIDIKSVVPGIGEVENLHNHGDYRDQILMDIRSARKKDLEEDARIVYPRKACSDGLIKVYHKIDDYSLVDFDRMVLYSFQCKRKPKRETQFNTHDIARLDDGRWVVRLVDNRAGLDKWFELNGEFQPNMLTMETAYIEFKTRKTSFG